MYQIVLFGNKSIELEVDVSNLESPALEIQISNNIGKEMTAIKNPQITKGIYKQTIDIVSWSKGEYVIRVTADNKMVVKKISID